MSLDYGEIICKAVDEIVSTRLQGLAYDITKLCTIVDDSNSYQGRYVVSDGTARYEAFTSDNSLKKGNSVLVTIPNGDYTMQKIIKGRVSTIDTTPFKYTSPLDTMVSLSGDVLDAPQSDEVVQERGLVANSPYKSVIGPIYAIKDVPGLSGFTRLGISANFKSLLSGLDVAQGTYGIKLIIYANNFDKPGVQTQSIYDLDFSSADMIGNPYQFEDYFTQEKVFDISYIGKINKIEVYFYQNKDFKDGNGNLIPYGQVLQNDIGLDVSIGQINNLFVEDVQVFLGYDINDFKGETLMLYTENSLSYHYKTENRKQIELRWIHLKEDGKSFTLLSKNNIDSNYEIRWFRYTPGCEKTDQYAGKDWEKIEPDGSNLFICAFTPDVKKQKEQIKAIGIIKSIAIDNKATESVYFSNLLTFENEEYVPDSKTQDAATALSIYCEDNSEGNYFIYNQNGKINNQGIGQGYKRTLKALFNGASITSDIGTLDWIKWYFPYEAKNSMLIFKGFFADSEVEDKSYSYKGTNYWVVKRYPTQEANGDGKLVFTSDEQSYSIGNQWSYKNSNNTVICRISVDGVEYEAIEEMRFGKSGTNGTNTTLLLEFDDNQNALIAENGRKISITAWLYNEEGVRGGLSDSQQNAISWSWYKKSNSEYMSLSSATGSSIIITSNVNYVPYDNYYILQATYNNLTAYLPIPMKTANTSYMEGAREILYNHQGIPSYYNDIYNLYYYTNGKYNKLDQVQWSLGYDEVLGGTKATQSYMPTLKKQDGSVVYGNTSIAGDKVALSAATFFASGYNDKICVYGFQGDYAWAQPILVMQSKYDFAMLNNWDGSLTLNEDNSTVLAAMLGAGRKNEDNSFSGVLIGDIKRGTDNNEANTLTGVYGLQNGVISYALTEDGKATLGANGNGQIIIDGQTSEIKTKGYDTVNQSGMKIDLNLGSLDIRDSGWKSLIHLSAGLDKATVGNDGTTVDPYFLVRTTEGEDLIRVDDSNYYLQSKSYSKPAANGALLGTRLNLLSGDLEIKSSQGRFFVSGSNPQGNEAFLSIGLSEDEGRSYTKDLLFISPNEYFLQSKDYSGQQIQTAANNSSFKIYKQPSSSNPWVSEYVAVSPSGDVYRASKSGNSYNYSGSAYQFQAGTQTAVDGNGNYYQVAISASIVKANYLRRLNPIMINAKPRGFKLDFKNNSLIGFDLFLKAVNSQDSNKFLTIDSSDPTVPLRISNNFSVDWNGYVTCINPTISGDGGTINLGNFYMSSSGAGGGTWNGSSTGIAGFSAGPLSSFDSIIWYRTG